MGGGEEVPKPRRLLGRVASVPSDGSVVMAHGGPRPCHRVSVRGLPVSFFAEAISGG